MSTNKLTDTLAALTAKLADALKKIAEAEKKVAEAHAALKDAEQQKTETIRLYAKLLEQIKEAATEAQTLLSLPEASSKFIINPELLRPIGNLGLSVRTVNSLQADGPCYFVGDLAQHTEAEVLRIPNIGMKMLNEIRNALAAHGLCLGTPIENWAQCRPKSN